MKRVGFIIVLFFGLFLCSCQDEVAEELNVPVTNAPSSGEGEDEDDPIPSGGGRSGECPDSGE